MEFLRICFPLLAYGNQQQCPAVPSVILLGKEKVLTSACFLAYSLCLSRVFPGLGGLPQSVSWCRFALKTLLLEAVPEMVLLLAWRSQVEGVLNSVGASRRNCAEPSSPLACTPGSPCTRSARRSRA